MKKILIIFLISSIFSMNVLAEEIKIETEDEILTMDEAIDMALKESPLLQKEELTKKSNFEVRDEVGGNIRFIPIAAEFYNGSNNFINAYKLYEGFDIAYDVSKNKVDMQKEKEIYDAIDKYKSNIEARLSQKFKEKDYEYNQMAHHINFLKKDYGLIGDIEYNSSSNIFEIARNTKRVGTINLNKANDSLSADIGLANIESKKLINKQLYDINQKLESEKLDSYLSRATSNSPLLQILEKNVKIKQLEIDYNTYNDPANYKPIDAKKFDVRAEEKNVENVKDLIESIVRESFYGAQMAQKVYGNSVNKYEIDKNLYEVKQKQFELGIITKLELLESEKTLAEDELNIEKAKNAFDMAMIILEKPYIKIPM